MYDMLLPVTLPPRRSASLVAPGTRRAQRYRPGANEYNVLWYHDHALQPIGERWARAMGTSSAELVQYQNSGAGAALLGSHSTSMASSSSPADAVSVQRQTHADMNMHRGAVAVLSYTVL